MEYNWLKVPKETIENLSENKIIRIQLKAKVLFLCQQNNRYFAGDNYCPHAGASLHNGFLNENGDIVCPHHRYCFHPETGKNTSGEGYYLHTYPVEERPDGVYVGFPKSSWQRFLQKFIQS